MRFRIRRLVTFLFLLPAFAFAAEPASRENAAEAQRLYDRALDYVTTIQEGEYSYAYLQFYWRRAQANIERIKRVYPRTPVGRRLANGELQLGPFPLDYFKERVLPRVEVKRTAAFDAVNCAIFLYNLDENRWDESRLQTMESLLTILCRQQRWNEAFIFPVRDEDQSRRLVALYRVAARFDQKRIMEQLEKEATKEQLPLLWPLVAEAMVYLGKPRSDLADFVAEHPEAAVREAVLRATVERELLITRGLASGKDVKGGIATTHFSILNIDLRDNVEVLARTLFPDGSEFADTQLAIHAAGLGRKPRGNAPLAVHQAYLDGLAASGQADAIAAYGEDAPGRGADRDAVRLAVIESLARAGEFTRATALVEGIRSSNTELGDAAASHLFAGQMDSLSPNLTVREHTFTELKIKDPCVLARSIIDWSLTPNRTIRGAVPWDPVVTMYLPGFENLPLAASKDAERASASTNPF